MSRLLRRYIFVTLAALAAATSVHGESILDHVPQDAIGFAYVRNLAAANAKIEKVEQIFQELSPQPLPAPLPLLKASTGLGPGLNEQGDALLAVLPGADGLTSEPIPLFLVALNDYAAFANAINADATGEICQVTIAGQEVLAAKRGSFVVLMNVENRDRLEAFLSSEAQLSDGLAPLTDWLNEIDVAAVLTPSGVDQLTARGQAELAEQRAAMEEQLADPQFAEMLQQAQMGLRMYENVLGFLGAKVDAAAAGIAIDDHTNVRLATQVVLSKDGQAVDVPSADPPAESPLAGYVDEPYVLAGGGPIPPAYGEGVAKMMRNIMEMAPGVYGFEDFSDEKWQELEESWRDSMKGLQTLSMVMYAGEGDDPLYSNVFGILKVDDAEEYLNAYRRAMDSWNDLLGDTSSDIKIKYDLTEVEVAGKQGLLASTDVAEAAGDDNVPMVQMMMKAMFGEDGTMDAYLIPIDDATIVIGIADKEGVEQAINRVVEGDTGLVDSNAQQTTWKLLEQDAAWKGVVSPQGAVSWSLRAINNMFAPLGGGAPNLPQYPDSPPIGFSAKLADGRFSTEMVWPVETLQSLVKFIKLVNEAFN